VVVLSAGGAACNQQLQLQQLKLNTWQPPTPSEALWLRTLLNDLGMDVHTIEIKVDSQSAIKLLKNPVFSMRSKHIDVVYHFALVGVTRKDAAFWYISTDKMVVDALTKPLASAKFIFCHTAMGIGGTEGKSKLGRQASFIGHRVES
jgi:hypothetical protein